MAGTDHVAVNLRTHLRFFRRNRLLIVATSIVTALVGLTIVTSSFFSSSGGHFATIHEMSTSLYGLVRFLVPGMGLLLLWSHLRDRSIKMVVTKPCSPESWLASGLLAAGLVSAVLHALILATVFALSIAWGVPLQSGFPFVALESFLASLVALAYVSLLTALFHPVVALLLLSVLNEQALYGLKFMTDVGQKSNPGTPVFGILGKVCTALYYLVPGFHPYSDKFAGAMANYRTTSEDWLYLAAAAGYAALAFSVLFGLAGGALRRKSLV